MTVDILHVASTSLGLSSVYTGVMSAIIIRGVLLTVGTARKTTGKPILVLHVTPSATRSRLRARGRLLSSSYHPISGNTPSCEA